MKQLRFGETHFDNLTRDKLLFEVRRMEHALVSAQSALRLASDPSPFWIHENGTGRKALHKVETALQRYNALNNAAREQWYRRFHRYAGDLFFPPTRGPLGHRGWMICEKCGEMIANPIEGIPDDELCRRCKLPMRPLAWRDLEPKERPDRP